jgi:hypothetical protein
MMVIRQLVFLHRWNASAVFCTMTIHASYRNPACRLCGTHLLTDRGETVASVCRCRHATVRSSTSTLIVSPPCHCWSSRSRKQRNHALPDQHCMAGKPQPGCGPFEPRLSWPALFSSGFSPFQQPASPARSKISANFWCFRRTVGELGSEALAIGQRARSSLESASSNYLQTRMRSGISARAKCIRGATPHAL